MSVPSTTQEEHEAIRDREARAQAQHDQQILDERALSARRTDSLMQPGVEDATGFAPGGGLV